MPCLRGFVTASRADYYPSLGQASLLSLQLAMDPASPLGCEQDCSRLPAEEEQSTGEEVLKENGMGKQQGD